jgi:hypothetical protein
MVVHSISTDKGAAIAAELEQSPGVKTSFLA